MANIGDVARHLGVSRSTVSYALSGKRPVSAETRERVEQAIRELDFWPSAAGRALATSRSETLALLAPMGANASPAVALQFVDGIARASRATGYDTLLVTGEEAFRGVDRLSRNKQVDGFLLLDVEEDDPRIDALRRSNLPSVLIGLPTDGADLNRVDLDWTAAGAMLVDQLAGMGHTQVCALGAPSIAHEMRMTYAEHFQQGVRQAAERTGVHVLELPAGSADATFRGASAVLADHPETTAFIVQHEPAVAPLMAAVTAAGRSVPDDLSITGVTVDALDPGLVTPISGVENPSRLVTRTAVDLLVEILDGVHLDPVTTLLQPTYVHRGTAGQAPG